MERSYVGSDKNSNAIFVGDIVKWRDREWVAEYHTLVSVNSPKTETWIWVGTSNVEKVR